MRISLNALPVLDVIARNGSFSAAGAELHPVPSAITDIPSRNPSSTWRSICSTAAATVRTWVSELRIALDDIIPGERDAQ